MRHVAAPPAVVLAASTAVVPRRRRSRAQMKALDLFYSSASRDWCRGAIKAFRLATLSGTTRTHRIRVVADKVASAMAPWPRDTNRALRIYGIGRGLSFEPSIASVAALQPSQWPGQRPAARQHVSWSWRRVMEGVVLEMVRRCLRKKYCTLG